MLRSNARECQAHLNIPQQCAGLNFGKWRKKLRRSSYGRQDDCAHFSGGLLSFYFVYLLPMSKYSVAREIAFKRSQPPRKLTFA